MGTGITTIFIHRIMFQQCVRGFFDIPVGYLESLLKWKVEKEKIFRSLLRARTYKKKCF